MVLTTEGIAVSLIAFISFSTVLSSNTSVIDIEQAKDIVEKYFVTLGNDFEIEAIMEFSNNFYIILQEESMLVNAFELLVDRYTGGISYEPGPNIIWNQKYGHMMQTNNSNISMPIDCQEASLYAQKLLDKNYQSTSIDELKVFYGYYTVDVSRDGHEYLEC